MTMTDLKRYISLVEQGPERPVTERRRIMRDQHDRITRQIRELRLAALETTEHKICVYDGHPEGCPHSSRDGPPSVRTPRRFTRSLTPLLYTSRKATSLPIRAAAE